MIRALGLVAAVVVGYLFGGYSQSGCPPGQKEAYQRGDNLTCVYVIEYVRPAGKRKA